jgi:glycosyltransferase involved in cell wall biosynthesis
MRILLANSTAYPYVGGVENSLRYIGRALVSEGHEARIFCLQFLPDEPLRMEHDGIEIFRYPCSGSRWPHRQYKNRVVAAEKGIRAILDDFRPDAIWSRNASVGLGIRRGGYTGPLLQIFPTNARMNCRGSFLMTGGLPLRRRLMLLGLWPLAYSVSSRIERELYGQCTPVAFSENMRMQLTRDHRETGRPCHVIHPGVDGEVFSPENGALYFETIEHEYGLSRSEPLVLYVGRLSGSKHIPLLMKAVAGSKERAKLVLVGSGRDEDRLRRIAQNAARPGRIVFAGSQDEMLPGFYAMSRVCVLPTTVESFGQAYLESLASGTPVVGFGGDGWDVLTATDEIVLDGKTGVIVRTVGAEALSEGIDSILAMEESEYGKMSRLCRQDVTERFSWKRFVSGALALSREV